MSNYNKAIWDWADALKERLLRCGKTTNLIDEVIDATDTWDSEDLDVDKLDTLDNCWFDLEDAYTSFCQVTPDVLVSMGVEKVFATTFLVLLAEYLYAHNLFPQSTDHWLDITRTDEGDVILNKVAASAYGHIELPDDITHIAHRAFWKDKEEHLGLKEVDVMLSKLPNSLKEIGDAAFCGCLFDCSTLVFPNSLRKIGKGAFRYTNVKAISIPSRVTLADDAFLDCRSIVEIDASSEIKSIIAAQVNKNR